MTIKEMLVRQNNDDRIEIGEIIERAMKGRFGDVFYALIEGLRKEQLSDNRMNPQSLSADRTLGRIEGFDILVDAVEQAVSDKNSLIKPLE